MHITKNNSLFGGMLVTGNTCISDLMQRARNDGHSLDEARGIAFWYHNSVQQLLEDIKTCPNEDECESYILQWTKKHHTVFETIARSKRKIFSDEFYSGNFSPKDLHKKWLGAYYKTEHWKEIRNQASLLSSRNTDYCALCKKNRDDWHHPHYEDIGTDDDVYNIVPLCSTHHTMAHVVEKIYPGKIPDRIQMILCEEGLVD